QLARQLLAQFPAEGVAGETLQQVRVKLDQYAVQDAQRKALLEELGTQVSSITEPNGRKLADAFAKEIAEGSNEDGVGRLASFKRLADDEALTPEQKVALAISGWLVGANHATDNFQVALSLSEVRDKVRLYLEEPLAERRAALAAE